jgi:hypothetical protein
MKVKLVTFSDGSYGLREAGKRLVRQADDTGWFSYPSEHWTLNTLQTELPLFTSKNTNFMKTYSKGLGLWIWKSAILSHQIEQLKENEIVLLLDAGCQINSTRTAAARFTEYLELCQKNEMLLMQLPEHSFGYKDLSDAAWTKKSVLDLLDPSSIYRQTNQIQSGIILAKKSEKSLRVAKKWLQLCQESEYKFLIDPAQHEPQTPDFKQHRCEQSILSLILKSEGVPPLLDETYFYPHWSDGEHFPIWAMRNRSGGDAFRRNFMDLIKILLAKIERGILKQSRKI